MLRAAVSAAARRGWRFASPAGPAQSAAFARRLLSGDTSEIDPNLDLYKVGPTPTCSDPCLLAGATFAAPSERVSRLCPGLSLATNVWLIRMLRLGDK